jgi:A/G-specific adenine glycosylase
LRNSLGSPPESLARTLLDWYHRERRTLPWRGSRNPYRIWISEVMLQQTQAAVVVPYYRRFLKRFGNVKALAAAELTQVLELWSGLGYYSRARNLHAAARAIVAQGAFPSTLAGLQALPGFGPYTAAAVGSIAFDLPEPAIDGNAVRVYARLVGLRAPRAEAEPRLRELARPLLGAGPPGDLNQAIMDLGQLVCRARAPSCPACPWRRMCRAHREGTTGEIPIRTQAPPRRDLIEAAARVTRKGTILLARRREQGLFGGLWELPAVALPRSRAKQPANPSVLRDLLRRTLRRELGLAASIGRELGSVDRTLTHLRLKLIAFDAEATGRPRAAAGGRYLEARFVPETEIARLGLSSASRKLLSVL